MQKNLEKEVDLEDAFIQIHSVCAVRYIMRPTDAVKHLLWVDQPKIGARACPNHGADEQSP